MLNLKLKDCDVDKWETSKVIDLHIIELLVFCLVQFMTQICVNFYRFFVAGLKETQKTFEKFRDSIKV